MQFRVIGTAESAEHCKGLCFESTCLATRNHQRLQQRLSCSTFTSLGPKPLVEVGSQNGAVRSPTRSQFQNHLQHTTETNTTSFTASDSVNATNSQNQLALKRPLLAPARNSTRLTAQLNWRMILQLSSTNGVMVRRNVSSSTNRARQFLFANSFRLPPTNGSAWNTMVASPDMTAVTGGTNIQS